MEVSNLLFNGLHSDNDPSAQPPNTYRDSLNGSIVTYGQNRYAWESVKGNKVSFTLPNHNSGGSPFTPIGFSSFPDKLIVFSTDGSTLTKAGEIGKVSFDNTGIGTYIPLYFHNSLNFSINTPIPPRDGQVVKPENNSIQRVYWTDKSNPMRAMNVVDPVFTTYIASGSLVVGQKYMVLTNGVNNTITHNAVVYGSGEVATNVFTAVNANYAGTAFVIQYVPVETLAVVPVENLGNIEAKTFSSGGSLFPGSNQYFYQLITSDGGVSNFSYVTRPIYVAGTNMPIVGASNTIGYQNYQGDVSTINSGKYITISINEIDTNYSKIRVGFIFGSEFGIYDSPKIFTTVAITGSTMTFNHFGTENTTTLTLADLTTASPSLDFVQALASSKNILFAANVGLDQDINFDMSSTVISKTIEYLMPGDTIAQVDSSHTIASGYGIVGHGATPDAGTGATTILPNQWYEVSGTGTVTYNAIVYNASNTNPQYFKGVFNVQAISASTGSPKLVAVTRIQKYTSPATLTAGNYKNIRIENDYCNYKGEITSRYLQSHFRGETYRFGFLLWNTKGAPLFVKFLTDKQFPQQYYDGIAPNPTNPDGYNPRLIEYNSTIKVNCIRALGMNFSNLDFNLIATALGTTLADLPNHIRGFSIVRCKRDEQIVGQGILYPVVKGAGNDIHPISTAQLVLDGNYQLHGGRRQAVYNWFCPEFLFKFNGRPNVASGDNLVIQDYYDAMVSTNPGLNDNRVLDTADATKFNYYYKHYVQASPTDATKLLYVKGALANIIPTSTVAIGLATVNDNIPGLTTFNIFQNNALTDAGDVVTPSHTGVGGNTMLISLNVDESIMTNGFGDHGVNEQKKPIVNWVRPKANLYGGTSAEAKANNTYIWTGHYQSLDSDFMTYMVGTVDATPSNPGQTKLAGIVNNVEVFGGDAFIVMQDMGRIIQDTSGVIATQCSFATIFPCETTMNTEFRNGRHYARNRFLASDAPDGISYNPTPSASSNEVFTYNGAYSNIESEIFYPVLPIGFKSQSKDPHLIMFSLTKTDGEIIDSWRIFQPNNQKRIDGQYGDITNIRAKSTRLFYWQNRGLGYLPVQERVMTSETLGDAVQLGIGGTLDRFDEIDYYYGNQHQFGLMEAEDYFGWFDFRRRAMLRMSFGGAVDKASMLNGLDSFLSIQFDDVESEASPNIFDSDNPFTGEGIVSVYDSRFKMGFMTFKYNKTNGFRFIEKDFTIGFNSKLDKYMGFFSFTPAVSVSHNGFFLSSKVVRPVIAKATIYNIGDEVNDTITFQNYICIVSFTSPNPPTQPSLDVTHWKKSSQINDIYVNWRNDICKFYGKVYESYVTIVIKGDGDKMSADNIAVVGNNTPFTDIYTNNSYQSAQDINIVSTNRNYKYIDGSWWLNLPFDARNSRMTDSWMTLKLRVKNFVTDPTVSVNLLKNIFSIKSSIRIKK